MNEYKGFSYGKWASVTYSLPAGCSLFPICVEGRINVRYLARELRPYFAQMAKSVLVLLEKTASNVT